MKHVISSQVFPTAIRNQSAAHSLILSISLCPRPLNTEGVACCAHVWKGPAEFVWPNTTINSTHTFAGIEEAIHAREGNETRLGREQLEQTHSTRHWNLYVNTADYRPSHSSVTPSPMNSTHSSRAVSPAVSPKMSDQHRISRPTSRGFSPKPTWTPRELNVELFQSVRRNDLQPGDMLYAATTPASSVVAGANVFSNMTAGDPAHALSTPQLSRQSSANAGEKPDLDRPLSDSLFVKVLAASRANVEEQPERPGNLVSVPSSRRITTIPSTPRRIVGAGAPWAADDSLESGSKGPGSGLPPFRELIHTIAVSSLPKTHRVQGKTHTSVLTGQELVDMICGKYGVSKSKALSIGKDLCAAMVLVRIEAGRMNQLLDFSYAADAYFVFRPVVIQGVGSSPKQTDPAKTTNQAADGTGSEGSPTLDASQPLLGSTLNTQGQPISSSASQDMSAPSTKTQEFKDTSRRSLSLTIPVTQDSTANPTLPYNVGKTHQKPLLAKTSSLSRLKSTLSEYFQGSPRAGTISSPSHRTRLAMDIEMMSRVVNDTLVCKNHEVDGRDYPRVLSGRMLVDWLVVRKYAPSREKACSIGSRLLAAGHLWSIPKVGIGFEDSVQYYQAINVIQGGPHSPVSTPTGGIHTSADTDKMNNAIEMDSIDRRADLLGGQSVSTLQRRSSETQADQLNEDGYTSSPTKSRANSSETYARLVALSRQTKSTSAEDHGIWIVRLYRDIERSGLVKPRYYQGALFTKCVLAGELAVWFMQFGECKDSDTAIYCVRQLQQFNLLVPVDHSQDTTDPNTLYKWCPEKMMAQISIDDLKALDDASVVLQIDPIERDDHDIAILVQLFSDYDIFDNFPSWWGICQRRQLCRFAKYEIFPPRQWVFCEGDVDEKFYIVLSGEVSVIIQRQIDDGPNGPQVVMECVNKISAGNKFGEAALQGHPRTASILTGENGAEFIVVSRQSYIDIMNSAPYITLMAGSELEEDPSLRPPWIGKDGKNLDVSSRVEKACELINDAIHGREPKLHRLEAGPLAVNKFLRHSLTNWALFLVCMVQMALIMFEPPARMDGYCIPGVRSEHDLFGEPYCESAPAVLGVEAAVAMVYITYIILSMYDHGVYQYFRRSHNLWWVFLTSILTMDVLVAWLSDFSYLRFSRALRPGFLLLLDRSTRDIYKIAVMTLPKLVELILLFLGLHFLYAVMGMHVFKDLYTKKVYYDPANDISPFPQGSANDLDDSVFRAFQNWGGTLTTLYVLLTTENYPEVVFPAYFQSTFNLAYFLSFIIIGVFFFLNLLLAVMAESYTETVTKLGYEEDEKNRTILHMAYKCLDVFHQGSISRVTFTEVIRKLRPNMKEYKIQVLFNIMDEDQNGLIDEAEFFTLCDHLDMNISTVAPNLGVSGCWGQLAEKLTSWKWYKNIMSVCIAIDIFALATLKDLSWSRGVDSTMVTIFACDILLNVVQQGLTKYIQTPRSWNKFDVIITLMQAVGIFYSDTLRILAILRGLKLIQSYTIWAERRRLVRESKLHDDAMESLKLHSTGTLTNKFIHMVAPFLQMIFAMVMVMFYPYAIVGMEMFATPGVQVRCNKGAFLQQDPAAMFCDVRATTVTLFQLVTTSNWHEVMYGSMVNQPDGVWSVIISLYYVTFMLFAVLILFNLMTALFLEVFAVESRSPDSVSLKDMIGGPRDVQTNSSLSKSKDASGRGGRSGRMGDEITCSRTQDMTPGSKGGELSSHGSQTGPKTHVLSSTAKIVKTMLDPSATSRLSSRFVASIGSTTNGSGPGTNQNLEPKHGNADHANRPNALPKHFDTLLSSTKLYLVDNSVANMGVVSIATPAEGTSELAIETARDTRAQKDASSETRIHDSNALVASAKTLAVYMTCVDQAKQSNQAYLPHSLNTYQPAPLSGETIHTATTTTSPTIIAHTAKSSLERDYQSSSRGQSKIFTFETPTVAGESPPASIERPVSLPEDECSNQSTTVIKAFSSSSNLSPPSYIDAPEEPFSDKISAGEP